MFGATPVALPDILVAGAAGAGAENPARPCGALPWENQPIDTAAYTIIVPPPR
jgi:hypothetical protein